MRTGSQPNRPKVMSLAFSEAEPLWEDLSKGECWMKIQKADDQVRIRRHPPKVQLQRQKQERIMEINTKEDSPLMPQ